MAVLIQDFVPDRRGIQIAGSSWTYTICIRRAIDAGE